MTEPVAGTEGSLVGTPGRAARLVPLLPALSFALLAVATGVEYEREVSVLPFCHDAPFGTSCLARTEHAQLLAGLAGMWAISALVVLVLMGIDIPLRMWYRGLRIPPAALLVYALFLGGLGVAALLATQPAGYGQMPAAIVDTLFYTYMTGALFLFALTFLEYRPAADSLSRSAVVAGLVHGILGMIVAAVLAYAVLFPPVLSY